VLVAGGPAHFVPWLTEIARQADTLRANNPVIYATDAYLWATMGDTGSVSLTLARKLLALSVLPKLETVFMALVNDPQIQQLARKWLEAKII
jgi:hypothetical protein